ncbi:ATP synthase mitochondrial F1 complex assembly factor 1 [Kwoniella heveanensis CBS 569]|nr:ATP synthase mitochondrial F1 complex assembly factor 1 [Kwoniella heveanensis CBS 569]
MSLTLARLSRQSLRPLSSSFLWSTPSTASTSRLIQTQIRCFTNSQRRSDLLNDLEKQLHPRELIERKRKEFEEKYGDKLKKRVEAEGVQDLNELKNKVLAPSVRDALKTKRTRSQSQDHVNLEDASASTAPSTTRNPGLEQQAAASKALGEATDRLSSSSGSGPSERAAKRSRTEAEQKQAEGDRSGIKPLASILNLPLLHLTPHDTNAISQIWTAYHTSHPTLSNSFLSATLPSTTYESMLSLAKQNPFFVLPLPRLSGPSGSETAAADQPAGAKAEVKTDEYEMFYLQWLFHPTPTTSIPPSSDAEPKPLPLTTSVIFTPLEEFKRNGEWAQPYLVLTHYPELSNTHSLVLMRGEISPTAAASGPAGSNDNPGFLLSQPQAQLLALALQRFYCTGMEVPGEGEKGKLEREDRGAALRGFRENPAGWDWLKLVDMAYGGLV